MRIVGSSKALAVCTLFLTWSCTGSTVVNPNDDDGAQRDAGPSSPAPAKPDDKPDSDDPKTPEPDPTTTDPLDTPNDGEPASSTTPGPSQPTPTPTSSNTPRPPPDAPAVDGGSPQDPGPSSTDGSTPEPRPNEPTTPSGDPDDFFGDSRCSDDFLVCEDFENGLDTDRWTPRGPTPTIDDSIAARGKQSLHVHTESNGLSYITLRDIFPVANNRYYARVFVRFGAMPTAPRWAHWTISGAEGSGTDAEIRIGGQYDGEINRLGNGTDRGPTGDWTYLDRDPDNSPRPVPVDEWVCLEWLNDGDAQESKVWWDDVEHPSLFTSRTEHGGGGDDYLLPEFESVWFGWWLYQADPVPDQYDVWLDEIVIDDEPIGCAR